MTQPIRLALAPLSTLIGFGIPSVLMTLPAPALQSYTSKLNWTAIQQGWPIWIYLAQKILEFLLATNDPMVAVRTEKQKRTETVTYMRRAYLFAMLTSAGAHLLYVGLGTAALLVPNLLSAKLATQLHPENFWVPPNPFRDDIKALSLPDGALWFLQWDLVIGVLSTMIWGISIRLSSVGKVDSFGAWIRAVIKYGAIAMITGPAGAAVVAVWGRDEMVLGDSSKTE